MEIKPTYVTFEQAKLLKHKSFNIDTPSYYNEKLTGNEKYSIGKRVPNYFNLLDYPRPEQWIVVEWLRLVHGIWIEVGFDAWNKETYDFSISIKGKKDYHYDDFTQYNSPQEVYEKAIDYVLNNLI